MSMLQVFLKEGICFFFVFYLFVSTAATNHFQQGQRIDHTSKKVR